MEGLVLTARRLSAISTLGRAERLIGCHFFWYRFWSESRQAVRRGDWLRTEMLAVVWERGYSGAFARGCGLKSIAETWAAGGIDE